MNEFCTELRDEKFAGLTIPPQKSKPGTNSVHNI